MVVTAVVGGSVSFVFEGRSDPGACSWTPGAGMVVVGAPPPTAGLSPQDAITLPHTAMSAVARMDIPLLWLGTTDLIFMTTSDLEVTPARMVETGLLSLYFVRPPSSTPESASSLAFRQFQLGATSSKRRSHGRQPQQDHGGLETPFRPYCGLVAVRDEPLQRRELRSEKEY